MGFYDFKGYWRNDGEGFYDAKGYFRSPGDGFYDTRGNWVSPGGAFYDGKGYLRTSGTVTTSVADEGECLVIAMGFILFIPIALLGGMAMFLMEWIISHLYVVFAGYTILDAILCLVITKIKRHQGINFAFSYIGNYICILSFIYIVLIYAVPLAIINGLFDFVLILGFGVGGITVIQFFNYYHEKPVLEFISGIVCFVIVIILLKFGTRELYSIEELAKLYNVEMSIVFKMLFGIAI